MSLTTTPGAARWSGFVVALAGFAAAAAVALAVGGAAGEVLALLVGGAALIEASALARGTHPAEP